MEARKQDIIPRQAAVEEVIDQRIVHARLMSIDGIRALVNKAVVDGEELQNLDIQQRLDDLKLQISEEQNLLYAEKTTLVLTAPANAPTVYMQSHSQALVDAINSILNALRSSGTIS